MVGRYGYYTAAPKYEPYISLHLHLLFFAALLANNVGPRLVLVRVEIVDGRLVHLVHDAALELEGRGALARRDREVVGENAELLDFGGIARNNDLILVRGLGGE